MSLHRDGQLAIVQIGLQCGADVPGNRPLRLLGYRAERRQRGGSELIGNQRVRRGKVGGFDHRADIDVAESGVFHQGAELDRIAESERRSPICGRLGTHVSLQCLSQGGHPGAPLDPAPDAESQPSAGYQDTTHLA